MRFYDAAASVGPYANNLHLAPDRQPHQLNFTGWILSWCPINSVKASLKYCPNQKFFNYFAVSKGMQTVKLGVYGCLRKF